MIAAALIPFFFFLLRWRGTGESVRVVIVVRVLVDDILLLLLARIARFRQHQLRQFLFRHIISGSRFGHAHF